MSCSGEILSRLWVYSRHSSHDGFYYIVHISAGGPKSLSGRPLHCLGMSRHFELMYNMGIQLLHCGRALPAFECLIEAVQIYHINPHLWLRLAECCIMAYREVCTDHKYQSIRWTPKVVHFGPQQILRQMQIFVIFAMLNCNL